MFHPNFDLEGHVCLNILRLDWSPVLPITSIFFGLLGILLEPEGEEPLNQGNTRCYYLEKEKSYITLDAGNMIMNDRREYNRIAKICAKGIEYDGIKYDNIMIINA